MVGSKTTKESHTMVFSGATVDQVADKVALLMAGRGYPLDSGIKEQGVYGRGSAAAHMMLGSVARRQKYNITIVTEGENVAVVLAQEMTAMGGEMSNYPNHEVDFMSKPVTEQSKYRCPEKLPRHDGNRIRPVKTGADWHGCRDLTNQARRS